MPSAFLFPPPSRRRAIAFGDTAAFLSSVIPAEAGIQRPKTRHSPLDSRLRGNDGNREVGEPKCDCPAIKGAENLRSGGHGAHNLATAQLLSRSLSVPMCLYRESSSPPAQQKQSLFPGEIGQAIGADGGSVAMTVDGNRAFDGDALGGTE